MTRLHLEGGDFSRRGEFHRGVTSSVIGIGMPSDFPLGPHDRVAKLVEKYVPNTSPNDTWREWAGGWTGLAYRFRAAAEYGESLVASYRAHSASPSFEERFRQEVDLFGFFVSTQSALECTAYGCFALGALANAAAFPMATPEERRRVGLRSTADAFRNTFPSDVLTGQFAGLLADPRRSDLEVIRNILVHRAQPPRAFVRGIGASIPEPTTWGTFVLDDTLTPSWRAWLATWLDRLLSAAEVFAANRL